MTWRWGLAGAYVVALVGSYAIRGSGTERTVPADVDLLKVQAVDGDRLLSKPVRLSTPLLAEAGAWPRAAAVTTTTVFVVWLSTLLLSYRRRRLLLSSWLRLTHWEYWPPWITYMPVAVYLLWLMLRHRSATAFTAANPAMPAGGFIGESKIEILRGLGSNSRLDRLEALYASQVFPGQDGSPREDHPIAHSPRDGGPGAGQSQHCRLARPCMLDGPRQGLARDAVARSGLIDAMLSFEAKLARAEQLMETLALDLPVVVKPDAGQRGAGVVIARTKEEVTRYLEAVTADTIFQQYIPGVEFGVFYSRHPSEPRGRILSVTEKHLPSVVGDGRRTLERLILEDRRALGMARLHLRRHSGALADVPLSGTRVSLGDRGSHCRGATFLDGRRFLTAAVEDAFDEIARGYAGFYFGRFDVRARSNEDFAAGRFTIIELNGVTSEATHIYDPHVGVIDAYRALFEQWRLAFEIGSANIARGAKAWSVLELVGLIRRYREPANT